MQYVNGLNQPSSRRCFLADWTSASAAAARFLDMTAAEAMFGRHVNVNVVQRKRDGRNFCYRETLQRLIPGEEGATGSGSGRSAARLSRWSLRNVALGLCGFHVRRSINPPRPDSLKRFHHSCDQNTHQRHSNPPTSNMSDYGGGDDEPMDYAMGECASPPRKESQ